MSNSRSTQKTQLSQRSGIVASQEIRCVDSQISQETVDDLSAITGRQFTIDQTYGDGVITRTGRVYFPYCDLLNFFDGETFTGMPLTIKNHRQLAEDGAFLLYGVMTQQTQLKEILDVDKDFSCLCDVALDEMVTFNTDYLKETIQGIVHIDATVFTTEVCQRLSKQANGIGSMESILAPDYALVDTSYPIEGIERLPEFYQAWTEGRIQMDCDLLHR